MIKQLFSGTFRLYIWPVCILVLVFLISMLLGLVLPLDAKVFVLNTIGEKFQSIIGEADTQLELTGSIFRNNLLVASIAYLLGFTITLPLLIMISNGMIMGLFLGLLYRTDAITPGMFVRSFVSLVPHGIFELTAFFLASALSIMVTLKCIFTKRIEPHKTRVQFFYESIMRFVIVIIPLLIIAGFVEVYVSNGIGDLVTRWTTKQQFAASEQIDMDQTFLAEHGCLLQPTSFEPLDSRPLSESLTATARVVYNPTIYTLLLDRKTIPYWEEEYYCNEETVISVQAWPSNQWSIDQALELQTKILSEAQLPFSTVKNNPQVMEITLEDMPYYIGVFEHQSSTVLLTWNSDNKQLYKKLLGITSQ